MSEVKKLSVTAIVLISLSLLAVAGIIVVDQIGKATRTTTSVAYDGLVVPYRNDSIAVGTTGQYPYLQTVTSCINDSVSSESYATSLYTVNEGTTDGGSITSVDTTAAGSWNGTSVNCTISYLAASSSSNTADNFESGLTIFGTFLGLIVITLVGGILIKIFRDKKD